MDQFPPNIPPRYWTLSSMIVGFALIDHFTANEQNAIGNWLMTAGQILEANASFQQVVEERFKGNTININSRAYEQGESPYMHNAPLYPDNETQSNNTSHDDIKCLKKMICIMQEEIEKLKKNMKL